MLIERVSRSLPPRCRHPFLNMPVLPALARENQILIIADRDDAWIARGAWKRPGRARRQISRGTSAANSYLKVYRSRCRATISRFTESI